VLRRDGASRVVGERRRILARRESRLDGVFARERRGIGHHERGGARLDGGVEPGEGGVAHADAAIGDGLMVGARVDVDLMDRRARQDIVELIEQQRPPARVEVGLLRRQAGAGRVDERAARRPQLRFTVEEFVPAVGALDPGLAGIRPAMVLQVEFADPARQLRVVPHALP